ncbi:DUF4270 domain-containing protein [Lacinutrix jangbogonensis]|uniref:DUF4270 domain-containing protein n=1 Tax=Lacinutrix jangbogonensis TaxID=1469557 RepID=UPI00053EB5BF|nr:DUF4270 domain-containing protein [Lacinutrix jangbogonensis]
MKKIINSLKSIVALGLILVISISCDSDFTNIESDIQGIKNFEATSKLFPFITRTQTFTPFTASGNIDLDGVQTNGLNGSLFGVYKNPTTAFGTTIASIVSQVAPITYNPDFGESNRSIESVFLNIPYFSTVESTEENGDNTYKLDSLIGETDQNFKLSIYRNNYVLRDLDPNSDFQNPQCYYSNQRDLFLSNSTIGDLLYENNEFTINSDEYRIQELDEDGLPVFEDDGVTPVYSERYAPGIRINLVDLQDAISVAYWENIFFANQGNDVLSTQSNFKDFFRGLIINVELNDTAGPVESITYLNFNAASILFDYTNQEEIDAEEAGNPFEARDATVYRLEFNGNRVNTFDQINVDDHDQDEDNLYLKGADGSMAVLELFSGEIENDEGELVPTFDYFYGKKDKWLINEANLVFYVNQDLIGGNGTNEPDRLTLYDLKNNTPILDYFLDGSVNTLAPNASKTGFSQVLERNDAGKGVKYKIRLTAHISNILQRDSTNVKLGLFLANNVNVLSRTKIQGRNNDDDDSTLDIVPSTSILSSKATVLHGYDENVNSEFRAEFEIFYTEPEN